jgi:site-specific DNA recombinase
MQNTEYSDPTKVIPAVLYAAKSTLDEKGSIPDQLKDARQLAAARGLDVVAEFQDEAASAYHGDRGPGLAQAMATCERLSAEYGSSALVVQHSDRLARGDARQARHLIEVVLSAIKHDVQLLSKQDPEILAGGDLALLLGAIGGMRNNQDSRRKSLAVKDGMTRRRASGKSTGGPAPFGYRWVQEYKPKTTGRPVSRLEEHPDESVIVRRIFADYVAGVSQKALAKALNDEHIRTRATETKPRGKPWIQSGIRRILINPTYLGKVHHRLGEISDGEHDPLVDEATFAAAQARMALEASKRTT